MSTSRRVGRQGKVYRNTGTWASPTWSEVTGLKDLARSGEWGEADAATRDSVFNLTLLTILDTVITGVLVKGANSNYNAIRSAFENGTPIELAIMDGPITTAGNRGLRAMFVVQQFSEEYPLRDEMVHNVTFKCTPDTNAPTWYTVST
jgi:hypothetical protein